MKKEYKKPQVVEVKLTIQNPILGVCWNVNSSVLVHANCQTSSCSLT